jgi:hypothetical protein
VKESVPSSRTGITARAQLNDHPSEQISAKRVGPPSRVTKPLTR